MLLTYITTTVIVDVYHVQVQAKVRLTDPAQPLFELSTCLHPNQGQRPSSLTRIMSKDRINAVRGTEEVAMKTLYDLPSKAKKREYPLHLCPLTTVFSVFSISQQLACTSPQRVTPPQHHHPHAGTLVVSVICQPSMLMSLVT